MRTSLLLALIIASFFISTIGMAACKKSIALTNQYSEPVYLSMPADLGYIPQVKVGEDYILPEDFLTCNHFNKTCSIVVVPINDAHIDKATFINDVPLGSRIFYSHPGKNGYHIQKADVCLGKAHIKNPATPGFRWK